MIATREWWSIACVRDGNERTTSLTRTTHDSSHMTPPLWWSIAQWQRKRQTGKTSLLTLKQIDSMMHSFGVFIVGHNKKILHPSNRVATSFNRHNANTQIMQNVQKAQSGFAKHRKCYCRFVLLKAQNPEASILFPGLRSEFRPFERTQYPSTIKFGTVPGTNFIRIIRTL